MCYFTEITTIGGWKFLLLIMITKTYHLLLLATLSAAVFSVHSTARAAILAQYPFTDNLSSLDTDTNSTVSTLGFFGGSVDSTIGLSAAGHVYFRGLDMTGTTEGAIANDDYFTFTFTPNAGTQFQLQTLTFNLGGSNNTDNPFTAQLAVYSSADGFASRLGDLATYAVAAQTGTSFGATTTIDLSGLGTLTSATPVAFRFYASLSGASAAGNNNAILRLDNIEMNGVLVPEPSVALMGALAGILGLSVHHRRPRKPYGS